MKATNARVTTLRLPPDIDQALRQYVERIGATQNKVILLALREYLAKAS